MSFKLIPDITVPICLICDINLKWYQRDAKRIMRRNVWNSKKFLYPGESYEIVSIRTRNYNYIYWLLELLQLRNGDVRITPMYEVELIEPVVENPGYVKIKKV